VLSASWRSGRRTRSLPLHSRARAPSQRQKRSPGWCSVSARNAGLGLERRRLLPREEGGLTACQGRNVSRATVRALPRGTGCQRRGRDGSEPSLRGRPHPGPCGELPTTRRLALACMMSIG
jgi:hypothetical protein